MGHDSAAEMEDAGQIDGEIAVPVLIGLLPDRSRFSGDSGVVHQDVNAPRALQNLLHRAADRLSLRHIRLHGEGAVQGRGDSVCALLIQIDHRDDGARARQAPRDGLADSGCRSADHGCLAAQNRTSSCVLFKPLKAGAPPTRDAH